MKNKTFKTFVFVLSMGYGVFAVAGNADAATNPGLGCQPTQVCIGLQRGDTIPKNQPIHIEADEFFQTSDGLIAGASYTFWWGPRKPDTLYVFTLNSTEIAIDQINQYDFSVKINHQTPANCSIDLQGDNILTPGQEIMFVINKVGTKYTCAQKA